MPHVVPVYGQLLDLCGVEAKVGPELSLPCQALVGRSRVEVTLLQSIPARVVLRVIKPIERIIKHRVEHIGVSDWVVDSQVGIDRRWRCKHIR